MEIVWDEPQLAVFDAVKNTKDNLAIQATAGAGKTTTILKALDYVPKFKRSVFLSFSNAIVDELKARVPQHVKASTLHSLGWRMIMSAIKGVKINKDKYFQLAIAEYPKYKRTKEVFKNCYIIADICNYARLTMAFFTECEIEKLCAVYSIDTTKELTKRAIELLEYYTKLENITEVDFTDMVYLPAMYTEIINMRYDYVFLDEAQDVNEAQAQLLENIMKIPTGRIIFVGDHRQAIYSFQGSSIDSFQQLINRFNAKLLRLTVTHRCAKEIVKLAQSVYPEDITVKPTAHDGYVGKGQIHEMELGDMVICRNTKPLISLFFTLIGDGVKSYVVGKDLEKGLVDLASSIDAPTKELMVVNMEIKLQKLIHELEEKDFDEPTNHPRYQSLLEKCDIIKVILSKVDLVVDLIPKIHEIFNENKKAVRLTTAHRAKGLECKRVFFLEHYNDMKLLPSKWATQPWELVQENNLLFVIYTRAKEEFYFFNYED